MKKSYLVLVFLGLIIQAVAIPAVPVSHFTKAFNGSGTDQMSIVLKSALLNGVQLEGNDEIAVFDGNLCCGTLKLSAAINPADPNTYLEIKASADGEPNDNGDLNGFKEGNKIYLRFWDASAGIEYCNIIVSFFELNGDPTTKTFTKNLTAFASAASSNATKTWTPHEDNIGFLWSDPESWVPAGVPGLNDNVVIPTGTSTPIISATYEASCGNITFDFSLLSLLSSASGTGSLIVAGNITGTNSISFKRYMTKDVWHLVSSPLNGQSVSSFLSGTATTIIPAKVVDGSRGMMDYSELNDAWNAFFMNSSNENLILGKGFGLRVTHASSAGNSIIFTGSLGSGDYSVPVTKTNNGWNLLGNPFTSSMFIKQEVVGFLTVNNSKLDASFKAVYLWDPAANSGSGAYVPVNSIANSTDPSNLAPGQGFFIKASAAGNVTFNKMMQVHYAVPFKSSQISWPFLVLSAKTEGVNGSTKIVFNENMSTGLDQSFDAGMLKSGNGFDIYSRLVKDNGVDFAVQALPGKPSDNYIIPIGVDATNGGKTVFSAQSLDLPKDYQVILEDKQTGILTTFTTGSDTYTASINASSKGTGRFFLHVGANLKTSIIGKEIPKVTVYTVDNTLYLKGDFTTNTEFSVFSAEGRSVARSNATSQNLNQISLSGLKGGVYFVTVKDRNRQESYKFVVY